MRLIFLGFLALLFLIPYLTPADANEPLLSRPSPLRDFLGTYLHSPSFHLSFFSYKPELGGLTDVLQSLGISRIPGKLLPTFSIVFEHTSELDSRIELGYWRMQIDIPPPTSVELSTTFIPVSYQLIYRPVLLSEFIPIYLGGGIGFLGTDISGSALDLLEEQGISFDNSSSGPTGYVLVGVELLQWEHNLSLTFELKRLLNTVETTGTTPFNLILDGTAIGLGIKKQF